MEEETPSIFHTMHPSLEKPIRQAQDATYTPLSKYLAMALFVVLPFVGFWFGVGWGNGGVMMPYAHESSDFLEVPDGVQGKQQPPTNTLDGEGPGGRIAFVDGTELYTILSDGTDRRLVYASTSLVSDAFKAPQWIDQHTIQFVIKDRTMKLYTVRDDGSDLVFLRTLPASDLPTYGLVEWDTGDVSTNTWTDLSSGLSFEPRVDDVTTYELRSKTGGHDVVLDTYPINDCTCGCFPGGQTPKAFFTTEQDMVVRQVQIASATLPIIFRLV